MSPMGQSGRPHPNERDRRKLRSCRPRLYGGFEPVVRADEKYAVSMLEAFRHPGGTYGSRFAFKPVEPFYGHGRGHGDFPSFPSYPFHVNLARLPPVLRTKRKLLESFTD
jgi:hypothetical protein